ncbi:MAG: helicase-related protein, partial [Imperialibacter sp.]
AEPDGARLLLCSEIGSEGRNFQFAHHLILFDLPAHPELLEQRIGRLDRIGQTEDIQIHVPYLTGSPQEVVVRWFHEGLNAFEENLEGGNRLAQLFGDRLKEATLSISSPNTGSQLVSLISDTATFQQELKQMLADGRDRLLEMNSFRPEVAKKLMEQIGEADLDMGLEKYMTQVFHHFSIDIEDLGPRTYLLHPTQANTYKFPSLPDEGMSVTFDRKRALAREDIGFVSWDHPMTTGAMDMVLSLGTGGASYGVLRGTKNSAILLEVLFVLETSGGQSTHVDRFLPATPLRVVVDHGGEDVTDDYPIELFDQQLRPGRVDDMLENDTLVDEILPNMLKAATAVAEELKADEVLKGMQEMSVTMNHEIGRLKALHAKNENVRPEEIQLALEERAKLASLIKNARIRMDAVQLVREGE